MNFLNRDSSIVEVAEYLREDVTQYCNNLPELNWPPSFEELTADNRLPPTSVSLFLTNLMKSKKHNISRLIYSFSADFIHGVIRGETITAKHCLMALRLHKIIGMKSVVQITSRLGHCLSYDKTAQALKAQILANNSFALPIKPKSSSDIVLTYFWVDNFDMKWCN